MTVDVDLVQTVKEYLAAFESRDMAACLTYYADNAQIDFARGVFRGPKAIEEWHAERFKNEMRVLAVDNIKTKGGQVVVDLTGTSRVARQWRFNSIPGRVTLQFNDGKIVGAKFDLRVGLPLDRW